MHISLEWLKHYVDVQDNEILEKLSLHTAEVEGFEKYEDIKKVKIGRIIAIEPHPNAEKLKVTRVGIGDKRALTIVTNVKDIEVGQKVPVALVGAKLAGGFEIKKASLRGVVSEGMFCGEDTLGLTDEEQTHLMVLPDDAPLGADVMPYLHMVDTVYEIENKSITHRPDLFGHYGIARDVSVIFGSNLKPYHHKGIKNNTSLPKLDVTIENPKTMKRLIAVRIDNIAPKASPMWLQGALKKIHQRPINSVVDITNYMMFDIGQPMHAFDADKVEGGLLSFGFSKAKEVHVETLDHVERTVPHSVLLVKDAKKPIALTGIMGLKNSEVTDETKSIILIVDACDPIIVRKGASLLGIRSEGSARQEKSLDPETTYVAFQKAMELLLDIHPEMQVSSQIVDIYPEKLKRPVIKTSYSFIQNRIGGELVKKSIIKKTLSGLGFVIAEEKDSNSITITVPSFRGTGDVSTEQDIVEEVARIIGFDNISPEVVSMPIEPNSQDAYLIKKENIRSYLSQGAGLNEIQNYSFYAKKLHDDSGFGKSPAHQPAKIVNPLSKEQEVLRTSLIPYLLTNVAKNRKHQDTVSIFEIEHIYPNTHQEFWDQKNNRSKEHDALGFAIATKGTSYSDADHPFFHAKQIFQDLQKHFGLRGITTKPLVEVSELYPWVHPNIALGIYAKDTLLGVIASVHPQVLSNLNITDTTVICCEVSLPELLKYTSEPDYSPVSQYPTVTQDFAFLVPERMHKGDILQEISDADPLITEVSVVDIYSGSGVPEGMISFCVSATFSDNTHTLKDDEVKKATSVLLANLKEKFDIELRA